MIDSEMEQELAKLAERMRFNSIDEALAFPQFFQIETIRHCNAHCPFCAIDHWDKSHPMMTDQLFDKVAGELEAHRDRVRVVDIQRAGEPLLDKKLAQRVRRLKEGGLKFVNLSTNASLLDETRGRALLEAGVDEVMLSIDSVEKKTYESIRVGLKFETVIQNIRTYFRLRDEINPSSVIRVRGVAVFDAEDVKHKDEMQKWQEFWAPLRKPQDRIYFKQLHNWGNTHTCDTYAEAYHLKENWKPCIAPWSTFHVTAMGIVPLCGQDHDAKMNMGDVNQQTIQEIWQGQVFNFVRGKHRARQRNDISFCVGCRLFEPEFSLEVSQTPKGHFPDPV